jgi:hypothetical protein
MKVAQSVFVHAIRVVDAQQALQFFVGKFSLSHNPQSVKAAVAHPKALRDRRSRSKGDAAINSDVIEKEVPP